MAKQLTLRGFLVGLVGLIIITASSMYVSLRMGALPWPTVFVTVVSLAALKGRKGATLQEINVTHTLMSAGAMVAGGLAFTIPGLWMLNSNAELPTSSLFILTICGAVLGTLFTSLFRTTFLEKEQLPYPMGQAAYTTLIAGTEKTGAGRKLFLTMGGSSLFTVARDAFGWIPAIVTPFKGTAMIPAFSLWISPMALGIGAIIGPLLALVWLGGSIFGYYILTPLGITTGLFSDMAGATLFRSNLGIGLMVGTGLGVFLKAIWNKGALLIKRDKTQSSFKLKFSWSIPIILILVIVALILGTDVTFLQSLVLIVGVFLTTYLSGMLTGQTGINPMEIFGILVLLVVQAIWNPGLSTAFTVAAVTSVACGLSGDVMNDLKSGHLLKTDPKQQILAEGIGGVIGSVIAVAALLVMRRTFGAFGTELLPSPQAAAVSAMAGGLGHPPAFFIGAAIGVMLFLLKVPAATLGLGLYLPIYISSAMGMGAVLHLIAKAIFSKRMKSETMGENTAIISSGLLGGEGITGVVIALISMIRG